MNLANSQQSPHNQSNFGALDLPGYNDYSFGKLLPTDLNADPIMNEVETEDGFIMCTQPIQTPSIYLVSDLEYTPLVDYFEEISQDELNEENIGFEVRILVCY
jgi:hypothetical protein